MKKIGRAEVENAHEAITKDCRPLEAVRLAYLFLGGSVEEVVSELKGFQNLDGGFGRALEPDFRFPGSSPIATSVAYGVMIEIGLDKEHQLVKDSIRYLIDSYDESQRTWYIVPPGVDAYPRAMWWDYSGWVKEDSTIIYPGNPGAELAGYFWHFDIQPGNFDLEVITREMIDRLVRHEGTMEEHELYCYFRMYEFIPEKFRNMMKEPLAKHTMELVSKEPAQWNTYVPKPLDFVTSRSSFLYPLLADVVEMNLDYLVDKMSSDGTWDPTWEWGRFPEDWEKAKLEWKGAETVKNLKILKAYDRLEL